MIPGAATSPESHARTDPANREARAGHHGKDEMRRVTSKDGTSIAYELSGVGQPVILVGGSLDDGSENGPLASALAEHFAVYNYARRGRGESDSTPPPYDVAREIADLDALIAEAGGSAHIYGVSTGGALALEAAAAGCSIEKMGVYEVPYNATDQDWPRQWREYAEGVTAALALGRRGDAVELFMRVTGSSDTDLAQLRVSPYWPELEAVAHTLAYDAAALGDGQPPTARLALITQPTLVVTGDDRPPGAAKWVTALDDAADAIAARVVHAERETLRGQGHVADPEAVVPLLTRFFA